MSIDLSELRKEYRRERLDETEITADPFILFGAWLGEAAQSGLVEANAMTLATATPEGRPSARVVLLKDFDTEGFTFFTNYESRKGQELAANPFAALTFWWGPLERQIRIEGRVEKLPAAESDAYYASRPLGARLGAWVSRQSTVIAGRDVLEARLAEVEAQYAHETPPRPPYWGGYRVIPDLFEFWQGGLHRLHDRVRYARRDDGTWTRARLSP